MGDIFVIEVLLMSFYTALITFYTVRLIQIREVLEIFWCFHCGIVQTMVNRKDCL